MLFSHEEDKDIYFLRYPYYTFKFKGEIPSNPFSYLLFCRDSGNISLKSYNESLEAFKKYLKTPNVDGISVPARFKDEGIPKNANIYTLTKGLYQESFSKDTELYKTIITLATEEDFFDINLYFFMASFFRLYIKTYISIEDIGRKTHGNSNSYNSQKEVYLYIDLQEEKISPILKQEIDGTIVIWEECLY